MKTRNKKKSDPLVGEYGQPNYDYIVIKPGEAGKHNLMFMQRGRVLSDAANLGPDMEVLKEEHTLESIFERIRNLDLDSYWTRIEKISRGQHLIAKFAASERTR